MHIQEGLLVVVVVAAVYYIIRYIRRQYFSRNAEGDIDCEKCSVKEVRRKKRPFRKAQES